MTNALGKKQLNLFDLTMIVVSLVIGMGIFRTPVSVAAQAGTQTIFFLAWFLGGVIALCGALTYAEIGSRYPVTGGYFKVFSYGYHPSLGFAINCIILVSNAASTAVVAVIGAEYAGKFFYAGAAPESFRQFVAIGAVVLFYAINLLGLKMSSRVLNLLMLVKIGLILLLLASIFGTHPVHVVSTGMIPGGNAGGGAGGAGGGPGDGVVASALAFLKVLGVSLIAVSFSYGGYQQTINFGGEVSNPSRIIPRGISYGIILIILLYLSINFVYAKVIGFEQLKTADSIAAVLMNHLFGADGETILRVLMFLSVMAYVNVSQMSNPRVMFAMSEEGILPAAFRKKTADRDVIVWSLTAFSAAMVITLLFSSTVDKIINYSIFLDSIGFATSAATIFIMRRRRTGEERDIYRIKWYPLVPAVLILAYICIATSIALHDPSSAAYGVSVFLCFFLLYFVVKKVRAASKGGADGR